MEALTLDRAKALAAEVVAEFGGDYKYPNEHREFHAGVAMCKYVHNEKPSCLVGQILHRHGVSLTELALNEFRGAWAVTRDLVGPEDDVLKFLEIIQAEQDEEKTWGESLKEGLNRVG